jgi:hypothetical protein
MNANAIVYSYFMALTRVHELVLVLCSYDFNQIIFQTKCDLDVFWNTTCTFHTLECSRLFCNMCDEINMGP